MRVLSDPRAVRVSAIESASRESFACAAPGELAL